MHPLFLLPLMIPAQADLTVPAAGVQDAWVSAVRARRGPRETRDLVAAFARAHPSEVLAGGRTLRPSIFVDARDADGDGQEELFLTLSADPSAGFVRCVLKREGPAWRILFQEDCPHLKGLPPVPGSQFRFFPTGPASVGFHCDAGGGGAGAWSFTRTFHAFSGRGFEPVLEIPVDVNIATGAFAFDVQVELVACRCRAGSIACVFRYVLEPDCGALAAAGVGGLAPFRDRIAITYEKGQDGRFCARPGDARKAALLEALQGPWEPGACATLFGGGTALWVTPANRRGFRLLSARCANSGPAS